jgi:hypothetical protein
MYLFADDACNIVTASSLQQLEEQITVDIRHMQNWFTNNGLVLNLAKTHVIHISLGGKPPRSLNVRIDDTFLEQVQHTKFLGVTLDSALKWDKHINILCGKLSGACFALGRLARVLPQNQLRSSYFSLFHSIMCYGLEFWGSAAEWHRVFVLQKRAIRIITMTPPGTPAKQLFINSHILTLPSQHIYNIAAHVHSHKHTFCTSKLTRTRLGSKERLLSSCHRLTKSSKTMHVIGPKVYNKLPEDIKMEEGTSTFKNKLKKWLIGQAFYNLKDFYENKN